MRMHLAAWMAAIVFGLGMVSSLEAGVWTSGHGDIDAHFHEADQELEIGLHFHSGAGAFGGGVIAADTGFANGGDHVEGRPAIGTCVGVGTGLERLPADVERPRREAGEVERPGVGADAACVA